MERKNGGTVVCSNLWTLGWRLANVANVITKGKESWMRGEARNIVTMRPIRLICLNNKILWCEVLMMSARRGGFGITIWKFPAFIQWQLWQTDVKNSTLNPIIVSTTIMTDRRQKHRIFTVSYKTTPITWSNR